MHALVLLIAMNTAHATDAWGSGVRRLLPDAVGVEIELLQQGLQPRNASVLYGAASWGADAHGRPIKRAGVGWRRLDGPVVLSPAPRRAGDPVCTVVPGKDPVPGGRRLLTLRPGVEPDPVPGIVLATGPDSELALARLQPGDTLQVVEAVHRRSGHRSERIELHQGDEVLTVDRRGEGVRACYTTPVPVVR